MDLTKLHDMPTVIARHNGLIEGLNFRYSLEVKPLDVDFKYGYTFYYGCGHRIYIYLNDPAVTFEMVHKIIQANYSYPEAMHTVLKGWDFDARVVMHDTEMGTISVW